VEYGINEGRRRRRRRGEYYYYYTNQEKEGCRWSIFFYDAQIISIFSDIERIDRE
jgi:hypothetical protein